MNNLQGGQGWRGQRASPSLGISSLVLGVVTFVTCWIPLVGILSIPMAGLGFLLGIAGLVGSVKRQGRGIGFAIAGSATCLLALVVSLAINWIILIAFWDVIIGRYLVNQTVTPLADPCPDQPQPGAEPGWPDASDDAVRQGDLRVRIDDLSRQPGAKELHIHVGLENVGNSRKIDYQGWGVANAPTLTDNFGNAYRQMPGHELRETLHPGKSVHDVLVFEAPLANVQYLRLKLPASAFGGWGRLQLEIPRSLLISKTARSLGAGVIPELGQLLANPSCRVRLRVVLALGQLGPAAVPELTRALRDQEAMVREAAATALSKVGPQAAVPELTRALRDQEAVVRVAAALALSRVGPQARGALPELLQAREDANVSVSQAAAQALSKIGPLTPAEIPILATALKSQSEPVRVYAIGQFSVLGQAGKSELLVLIQALADPNADVRRVAAEILEKFSFITHLSRKLFGAILN